MDDLIGKLNKQKLGACHGELIVDNFNLWGISKAVTKNSKLKLIVNQTKASLVPII